MGGALKSADNGSTVIVGEVQLARAAWSDVVVDDSVDFGTKGLISSRCLPMLRSELVLVVLDRRFDWRDSIVCELIRLISIPRGAVRDILAVHVNFLCDQRSRAILRNLVVHMTRRSRRVIFPGRRELFLRLWSITEALEIIHHPQIKLKIFGIMCHVGEVVEKFLQAAWRQALVTYDILKGQLRGYGSGATILGGPSLS